MNLLTSGIGEEGAVSVFRAVRHLLLPCVSLERFPTRARPDVIQRFKFFLRQLGLQRLKILSQLVSGSRPMMGAVTSGLDYSRASPTSAGFRLVRHRAYHHSCKWSARHDAIHTSMDRCPTQQFC